MKLPYAPRSSYGFHRFEQYVHFYASIPKISTASLLEITWKELEWLPHFVLCGENAEIRLQSVVIGEMKILECRFGNEPYMRGIDKRFPRRVIGRSNIELCARAANTIQLLHERHEVMNVFNDMVQVHGAHTAIPKWHPIFKIAHHVNAGYLSPVHSNGSSMFIGATTNIKDKTHLRLALTDTCLKRHHLCDGQKDFLDRNLFHAVVFTALDR